jgi:hypothetical protein
MIYSAFEEKTGDIVIIRHGNAKELCFSEFTYLGDISLDEVKDLPSFEKTSNSEYSVTLDDFMRR